MSASTTMSFLGRVAHVRCAHVTGQCYNSLKNIPFVFNGHRTFFPRGKVAEA